MTTDHAPPTAAATGLAPGRIVGERYLVGEVLGGGGMGVVCAGTHVLLGTPVAIKVIHSELKGDHEVVQRFINEARAAAVLKGEHIARVFDVGLLDSGEPYLVMEQLEGLSLDLYLAGRGPLGQGEAVDIALQVCEGLAEAHAAGLVHRDIKPANLFMARRPDQQLSVKILDFGIAKRVDTASPALTDPGKSLGSPWYMSPEQMLTPSSVDQHADVWSLGVLLFELLTARLPFEGDNVPRVCANVLAASAPRPSDYRGDVARELDAIVLRCLEKDPTNRFASASELAQALQPFASNANPLSVSESVSELESSPIAAYDSLGPVQGGTAEAPSSSRGFRHGWLALIALAAAAALLLPRSWLLAPELTFTTDAGAVALDAPPPARAGAGKLAANATEPPRLLQYLRGARAVPELERPIRAVEPRRPRERDQAWQRAQELKRQHDSENRYGL